MQRVTKLRYSTCVGRCHQKATDIRLPISGEIMFICTLRLQKRAVGFISVVSVGLVVLMYAQLEVKNYKELQVLRKYVMQDNVVPVRVISNARFAEYCNLPTRPIEGAEGDVVSKKVSLTSVHVIMRHGDHAIDYSDVFKLSKNTFKDLDPNMRCDMSPELLSNPALSAYVARMQLLRKSTAIAENLFPDFDTYPNRPLCNGSHLTGIGAVQALAIGDYLRYKYASAGRQWGEERLESEDVLIRCANKTRTYHNALAVAHSFLPHLNLAYVKFIPSEGTLCDQTLSDLNCTWPKARRFIRRYLNFSVEYHKKDAQFQSVLAEIADVYNNSNVLEIEHPWPFLDTMMVSLCHNISYTCNRLGKCITAELIQALWDTLDSAKPYWADSKQSLQKYRTINGLPLMREIANRLMNQSIVLVNNTDKNITSSDNERSDKHGHNQIPRFILYSGHGDNIAFSLETLQAFSQRWPPYASRLVIESYIRKKSGKQLLKFIYNGRDITTDIPFCRTNMRVHDNYLFCKQSSFINFIRKHVCRLFKGRYKRVCRPKRVAKLFKP